MCYLYQIAMEKIPSLDFFFHTITIQNLIIAVAVEAAAHGLESAQIIHNPTSE